MKLIQFSYEILKKILEMALGRAQHAMVFFRAKPLTSQPQNQSFSSTIRHPLLDKENSSFLVADSSTMIDNDDDDDLVPVPPPNSVFINALETLSILASGVPASFFNKFTSSLMDEADFLLTILRKYESIMRGLMSSFCSA
uniref:Uncharacterized protein n=1 Tax=Romanomermis culicivorax TaxID=13658 RepID=A0A915J9E9_ROMCU